MKILRAITLLGLIPLLSGCDALKKVVNWDWDLSGPINYSLSWAHYHITQHGIWGYLFVAMAIIFAGYSSDLTRHTTSMIVSSLVRSASTIFVLIFGASAFKLLQTFSKAVSSQFFRIIKVFKG